MNIFAGNLLFESTEADVRKLFEGFGTVASVAIVMTKDKKTPKSRGFGFVDMPDQQQAMAAIEGLDGREFMGRAINVSPAHPETEKPRVIKARRPRPKRDDRVAAERLRKEGEQGEAWFSPVFNKHLAPKDGRVRPFGQPGTYRGGRRTRSYMKRQAASGMPVEFKPRRRAQDNPMRWRKRRDQAKPWQKGAGENRPWQSAGAGERKPWQKSAGERKPWQKSAVERKPWQKPVRGAKPWSKTSRGPKKSGIKGRGKPGGFKARV